MQLFTSRLVPRKVVVFAAIASAAAILLLARWMQPTRAAVTPRPVPSVAAATPVATPTRAPRVATIVAVANAGGRGPLVALEADGSGARPFADGEFLSPLWSPDGTMLAALSPPAGGAPWVATLFEADGHVVLRTSLGPEATPPQLRWSAGRPAQLLVTGPGGTAGGWVVDRDGARAVALDGRYAPESWGPEGELVYALSAATESPTLEAGIWLARPDGGGRRLLAAGDLVPLGLSPDGSILFALGGQTGDRAATPGAGRGALLAITIATGERAVLVDAPQGGTVGGGVVAPDGRHVAIVGGAPNGAPGDPFPLAALALVASDGAGGEFARLGAREQILGTAWSPDGKVFAVVLGGGEAGDRLCLYRVSGGDRCTPAGSRTIAPKRANPSVSWSPDGGMVLVDDADGTSFATVRGGEPAYIAHLAGFIGARWRPAGAR